MDRLFFSEQAKKNFVEKNTTCEKSPQNFFEKVRKIQEMILFMIKIDP